MKKIVDPKKKRSDAQRKYYFGVIVEEALGYYKEHPTDLIRDVLLANKADLTKEFVHALLKMLFNKGETTNLESDEVSAGTAKAEEFHLKVRRHFDVNYQFHIHEPNEEMYNV